MTEEQLKWQKRSRILWRLNGMVGFPFEEGVLTPLENDRLNTAFGIIRGVIQDSVESSIFLWSSISYGFDIVIDNMNLNPKELEYYNRVLDDWNNPKGIVPAVVRPKYDLEFKDFFIPLQDCIERDSKRPDPIGEEVIRKTYEKYKDILKV